MSEAKFPFKNIKKEKKITLSWTVGGEGVPSLNYGGIYPPRGCKNITTQEVIIMHQNTYRLTMLPDPGRKRLHTYIHVFH